MITKFELENFAIFREKLSIEFSPKINLIIGENGTGKTQLLKAAYALSKVTKFSNKNIESEAAEILKGIYRPINDHLGKLITNGLKADNSACIRAEFPMDSYCQVMFNAKSQKNAKVDMVVPSAPLGDPCFIPTKEVLSLVHGIKHDNSDSKTISRLFDTTYLDLCDKLFQPVNKQLNTKIEDDPRLGTIYTDLANKIHGVFSFNSDGFLEFRAGFYNEKTKSPISKTDVKTYDKVSVNFVTDKNNPISGNMAAEGIRKIGVVQRLLENGTLLSENYTTLFWDEPESNLNPCLMKLLVEMILEISRNGVQVIIATHDYMLLKWFDILRESSQEDHVLFHSLSRSDTGVINIDSNDDYLTVSPNQISESFSDISIAQAKKRLLRK